MAVHITKFRGGFGPELTWITTLDETEDPAGIALGIHNIPEGGKIEDVASKETAYLLLRGEVRVHTRNEEARFSRDSLFDDRPSALHVPAGERFGIEAKSPAEVLVAQVDNETPFAPALYPPNRVEDERRGLGKVRDASFRFVRTIFDDRHTGPGAQLVLGEVVTLPGRWSSYPPHHHPQPEIYHYRFTDPAGYGHAELGDQVLKVRHNDTVKILRGVDHPQCAAPGYGMYYTWVIRHLPHARYSVPEFAPEHTWTMTDGSSFWWPKDFK